MVTLTVVGVVGFMLVAAASPLDALYMTVITLSTVGYNEIVPLDQGGQVFAIALIIAGISAIGYTGAVMVSTGDDAANVYTVLSARATAPHVAVIARANTDETVERLTVAGATRAFSPHAAGAQHMAAYVLKPNVAWALSELLDEESKDMTIKEVAIGADSSYVGRSIGEVGLRQHGVEVMAIGPDRKQRFLPARDEKIRTHDVLVMIGPPPNVRQFAEQAGE